MKTILGTILLLGCLLLPQAVLAQTDRSIVRASLLVQPAILELHGSPGESLKTSVGIINQTDKAVPVRTLLSKLDLQDDGQTATSEVFDASRWFRITDPDYILQPRQQRDVVIEVKLPLKAEPGGHYATIYFVPLLPFEALATDATQTTARVGVLAFVTVAGQQTVAAELSHPLATRQFRQFGPIDFHFGIKNDGNTHLLPGGQLQIFDPHGKLADEITLPPGIVLPHTSRDYVMTWNKRFLLGHYTAKLNLSYGANHKPLLGQTSFWVAPGIFVGLLILVLILIIVLLFRTRGRWGRALRVLRSRADA